MTQVTLGRLRHVPMRTNNPHAMPNRCHPDAREQGMDMATTDHQLCQSSEKNRIGIGSLRLERAYRASGTACSILVVSAIACIRSLVPTGFRSLFRRWFVGRCANMRIRVPQRSPNVRQSSSSLACATIENFVTEDMDRSCFRYFVLCPAESVR